MGALDVLVVEGAVKALGAVLRAVAVGATGDDVPQAESPRKIAVASVMGTAIRQRTGLPRIAISLSRRVDDSRPWPSIGLLTSGRD